MREHRANLQKPRVYLTFDVERDYVRSGYLDPPSFQGIEEHVPRILDKLAEVDGVGTFFLTPEVVEKCGQLVAEIRKRHLVGLHSHVYYQPEFLGWKQNGDSYSKYEPNLVRAMITRDAECFQRAVEPPTFFRIGRLEPDHTVLRTISDLGCAYDSSFHRDNFNWIERVRCLTYYKFKEVPVTAHLFGLGPRHFRVRNPVILVHPITPPETPDKEVFDLDHLNRLVQQCSKEYRFSGLDQIS